LMLIFTTSNFNQKATSVLNKMGKVTTNGKTFVT